jgi:hypothetical protein
MTQTQGLGHKDYLLWTERTLCPFLLPSMPESNPEDGMDLALCWRKPRGRKVPSTLPRTGEYCALIEPPPYLLYHTYTININARSSEGFETHRT